MTTDQERGPEFDRLYQLMYDATKAGVNPSLTSLVRDLFDRGVRPAPAVPGDEEIVSRRADELRFGDVGLQLRWTIPDPGALIEQQTPWRELAWIGFDGFGVQIGLYPEGEQDVFEEFYLEQSTRVETTVFVEEGATA